MNLVSCSSCDRQFDIISRGWSFSHCSQHVGVEPLTHAGGRDLRFGELSDSAGEGKEPRPFRAERNCPPVPVKDAAG